MEQKFDQLKTIVEEIADLSGAAAVLEWDQQTYMPAGGTDDRGNQLATLQRLVHGKITSDEVGKLLDELEPWRQQLAPDSFEARFLETARHEYDQLTKVTPEWVTEFAKATTAGQTAWEKARHDSNFEMFRPKLERIVELRREYAGFFAPYDHVYDPLLDNFERGMKTTEVQEIFGWLRPRQVELIRKIQEKPQVEDGFYYQDFGEAGLTEFSKAVITDFGYDWERGRLDNAAHPFSINFGIGDVRITTRYVPDLPFSTFFSITHEGGHAMYEQGVDRKYARTPLSGGASMALHESQSRMFENLIGRSLPFWRHYYPILQARFPQLLGNVSLEQFYKAANKVEPSLIRVEADEATYNLHIMLRLELEIALMEGSLAVKDLPEAWNSRVQEYLGITPPNDAKGVLQDVHWSGGMIGYFPTYALGNLVSVQLWDCMQEAIPDLEDQVSQGKFGELLGWLRTNVHQHGSKFKPQELIQKVTGSKIDPAPYMRYLESKFGEIYGL